MIRMNDRKRPRSLALRRGDAAGALVEIVAAAAGDAVQRGAHRLDPLRHDVQLCRLRLDELRPAGAGGRVVGEAEEQRPGFPGIRVSGDAKTVATLAKWTVQERLCCPFFDIELRFSREGGPVTLRLSGRKGTKKFVQIDGAEWIKR